MKKCVWLFIIFIYLSGFFSGISQAQPFSFSGTEDDTLKVGVVLSGGGAKGIAHIGVLKKLEEAGVRIDFIAGTSMGSLIGALYSIGYTTDQLEELAKSSSWEDLFLEKPSRRYISNYQREFDGRTLVSVPIIDRGLELPYGIISGQNIFSFLSRYTWPVHDTEHFDQFPIPFATVATNLKTGKPKTFKSGYLPDAIRASLSIPSLMRPHVIDDTTYIDGGVSNNLPVNEVRDMGANYVISVNVAAPLMPVDSLRSFPAVFNQVVNYLINERIASHIESSDIYISPEKVDSYEIIDFDKADELIEIGLNEGDRYLDQFKEVATAQHSLPQVRQGIGDYSSLPFNQVIVEGNDQISDEFILSELQIEQGAQLNPDYIEQKISQLYSTQLFDLITYRVMPDESNLYNLHIQVIENSTDVFRVGIRYETDTEASILMTSSFSNIIHNGSTTRIDARLGSKIRFMINHMAYGALGSRLGVRTSILYESEDVNQFSEGERIAQFKNHLLRFEGSIGNYLSSNNLLMFGIRRNNIFHTHSINLDFISKSKANHQAVVARFVHDRFHRTAYPTNGTRFILDSQYSGELTLSNISYKRIAGLFENYYDITPEISLRSLVFSGYSDGDELPWNAWYSINQLDSDFGFVRFGGLNRYENTSKNIQLISAGMQIEPIYHRFINIDYYAGRFLDEWNLATDNIVYGASLTVGALTILGPLKAILSTSTENYFLGELQLGFQF